MGTTRDWTVMPGAKDVPEPAREHDAEPTPDHAYTAQVIPEFIGMALRAGQGGPAEREGSPSRLTASVPRRGTNFSGPVQFRTLPPPIWPHSPKSGFPAAGPPRAGVALRGAYGGVVHRHAADIAARNGGGGHCGARGAGRAGALGILKPSRH